MGSSGLPSYQGRNQHQRSVPLTPRPAPKAGTGRSCRAARYGQHRTGSAVKANRQVLGKHRAWGLGAACAARHCRFCCLYHGKCHFLLLPAPWGNGSMLLPAACTVGQWVNGTSCCCPHHGAMGRCRFCCLHNAYISPVRTMTAASCSILLPVPCSLFLLLLLCLAPPALPAPCCLHRLVHGSL